MLGNTEAYSSFKSNLESLPGNVVVIVSHTQMDNRKEKYIIEELLQFDQLISIPVANTLMGLGTYPGSDDLSLQMLGLHGTIYTNYAVDKSDLLLAFGVRMKMDSSQSCAPVDSSSLEDVPAEAIVEPTRESFYGVINYHLREGSSKPNVVAYIELNVVEIDIGVETVKVEPVSLPSTGDSGDIQEDQGLNDIALTNIGVPESKAPRPGEPQTYVEHSVLHVELEGEGMDIDEQLKYFSPRRNEGDFIVSDLVRGKFRSHPWWPWQIFDPDVSQIDKNNSSEVFNNATPSIKSASTSKYNIIVVVVVVGYGYAWWKGSILPNMMFASKRSLSDAVNVVAKTLDDVYSSLVAF
ncbi:acetolactate synthase [Artemisia annua]|uniref:Acetolactate synthase n=1 Tax=Artemisia annua TaxID=35608 RepID=A0A2U1KZV1_ARTAN|nr:acetolactate synthase [Artemisia annua]